MQLKCPFLVNFWKQGVNMEYIICQQVNIWTRQLLIYDVWVYMVKSNPENKCDHNLSI